MSGKLKKVSRQRARKGSPCGLYTNDKLVGRIRSSLSSCYEYLKSAFTSIGCLCHQPGDYPGHLFLAEVCAEVGIDEETGEYDPPGPAWKGATDAGGRLRLFHRFGANTMLGKDGKVRGRVVFNRGTSIQSFSYLLVVKAPGYREESINLELEFPRGIDYEDPSPRTIQVLLSPSPPR